MSEEILNLRAHHLLCSVLFEEHGYSETFTENMTGIVEKLKDKNTRVNLQTSRDIICGECPNLKPDGGCELDDKIPDLDKLVLDTFNLSANMPTCTGDIFANIKKNFTPEFFNIACGDCRWHKCGLCSAEKYIKNLNNF